MKWLPDMDLNHDKQIQSLLCYRYTIGQTEASHRLKNFLRQSSRQAADLSVFGACPHPNLLPHGEGESPRFSGKFDHRNCNRRLSVIRWKMRAKTRHANIAKNRRTILPLLGERAGVRAVVTPNFSVSRTTPRAFRN